MIKIGFLGPAPPFRGGISQFNFDLASTAVQMGYEIKLFNLIQQYPKWLFPSSNQEDISFQEHLTSERVLTAYLPMTWGKTVRSILDFNPEILIISYWLPFFAPAYTYIMKRLKPSSICKVILGHNLTFHEKWLGAHLLTSLMLRRADKLLVLSQSSIDVVKKDFDWFPNEKVIRGFHPCYDSYAIQKNQIHNQDCMKNNILFFGLIKKYKGLDLLLQAMPMIIEHIPDIKLTIAGDVYGSDKPYLKLIKDLAIERYIDLHFKYIPKSEVVDFFTNADACILPYRSATQSGIVQLSYAFNKPVIASDIAGIAEYVVSTKTGLLFEPNSPKSIAATIIQFYNDYYAHKYIAEIEQFKNKFSWENLIKLIVT